MDGQEEKRSLLSAEETDNVGINVCTGAASGSGISGGCGSSATMASESSATPLLVLCTSVSACAAFSAGFAGGYSSPAETGIMDDLDLTVAEYSVFGSLITVGALTAAVVCGKMADTIGRRGSLWVLGISFLLGWLAISFAKAAWLLDLGRVFLGFGFGLTSFTVPVYLSEISPKNLRGLCVSAAQMMTSIGVLSVYLIGFVNWRALALAGTIPCVLQFIGLFFIPESPRWLAKVGRDKESEAALRRLRGERIDISAEAADIQEFTENLRQMSEGKFLDLFQSKYASMLIIGIGLVAMQQLAGLNGVTYYLTEIFDSAGVSSGIGYTVVSVLQIPAIVGSAFLVDSFGRRTLLMISATGSCLGCILTGVTFLMRDYNIWNEATPVMVLIGVLVYLMSYGVGMVGIPWIIISEILPINIKGAGGSLCNVVSWTFSWVVSYTFSFLFLWSSAGTFFIYSGACMLGIIFAVILVPETKGKTLEELQAPVTQTTR